MHSLFNLLDMQPLFNLLDTACNFVTIVTNKFRIHMKDQKVWSQESSIGFRVLVRPHFMFYQVCWFHDNIWVSKNTMGPPSSWMSDLTLAFLWGMYYIHHFVLILIAWANNNNSCLGTLTWPPTVWVNKVIPKVQAIRGWEQPVST